MSNEILNKYRGMVQEIDVLVDKTVHNLIDPYNTNYWDKLIKRTHTLLSFLCRRQGVSDASMLDRAKMLRFRYVMRETKKAHSDRHLKKLYLKELDGLIVVIRRASAGLSRICGSCYLPVVMGKSRISCSDNVVGSL